MTTVGILPNADKDRNLVKTREISAWLAARNVNVKIWDGEDSFFRASDFVLVLGGDGTLLRASHLAAVYDTPLLGVNLGTLGYLTDVEYPETYAALERVLAGNYALEKRMMLRAELNGTESPGSLALNDICLTRGALSKMATIELAINGAFIDAYRGDGLIISTPTGSTAYSLSAGGPVLKPDAEMIAVTPICPHKIYARSIVISAEDTVELKPTDCSIAIDGQNFEEVRSGDVIRITRSPYDTTVIKTNTKSFFDILRCKMGAGLAL